MLCPSCGLESECGTVNFFCVLTCTFGAPPYFKPWIHPCPKTLNHASCDLVHQSFTSSPQCFAPKNPLPISAFHFSFSFQLSFQLFISSFQLSFSSFSSYPISMICVSAMPDYTWTGMILPAKKKKKAYSTAMIK